MTVLLLRACLKSPSKPFVVSLSNHEPPFDRLRACPVLDTGVNGIPFRHPLGGDFTPILNSYANQSLTVVPTLPVTDVLSLFPHFHWPYPINVSRTADDTRSHFLRLAPMVLSYAGCG